MSLVMVVFNSKTVTAGIDSFINCHPVALNVDIFLKTFFLPKKRDRQYPTFVTGDANDVLCCCCLVSSINEALGEQSISSSIHYTFHPAFSSNQLDRALQFVAVCFDLA